VVSRRRLTCHFNLSTASASDITYLLSFLQPSYSQLWERKLWSLSRIKSHTLELDMVVHTWYPRTGVSKAGSLGVWGQLELMRFCLKKSTRLWVQTPELQKLTSQTTSKHHLNITWTFVSFLQNLKVHTGLCDRIWKVIKPD
jgi:hypothetical protein